MDASSALYILKGVPVTLKYTFVSFLIGLFLGTLLSLGKLSKKRFLGYFVNIYVSIFRGTPIVVQLSMVYFVIPVVTHYKISIFEAGVIAFSLNSAAYITEIIRSGIMAIDRGQFETAKALSVPYFYTMKDIILPQAIRNCLPSLVNEIVGLLKETAVISFFGEEDIMKKADAITAAHYDPFYPLLLAAACYYVMVVILSRVASYLEKRLKTS